MDNDIVISGIAGRYPGNDYFSKIKFTITKFNFVYCYFNLKNCFLFCD